MAFFRIYINFGKQHFVRKCLASPVCSDLQNLQLRSTTANTSRHLCRCKLEKSQPHTRPPILSQEASIPPQTPIWRINNPGYKACMESLGSWQPVPQHLCSSKIRGIEERYQTKQTCFLFFMNPWDALKKMIPPLGLFITLSLEIKIILFVSFKTHIWKQHKNSCVCHPTVKWFFSYRNLKAWQVKCKQSMISKVCQQAI